MTSQFIKNQRIIAHLILITFLLQSCLPDSLLAPSPKKEKKKRYTDSEWIHMITSGMPRQWHEKKQTRAGYKWNEASILKLLADPKVGTNRTDVYKNNPVHFVILQAVCKLQNNLNSQFEGIALAINFHDIQEIDRLENNRLKHIAFKNFKNVLGQNVVQELAEKITTLLKYGAKINALNEDGNTPLHLAALNGCLGPGMAVIIELLIEKGAEVNSLNTSSTLFTNITSNTPLHFAAAKGNVEIVKTLINKGAFINAVNADYKITPLHLAVLYGNLEIAKFLLQSTDIEINPTDKSNYTPLHFAAAKGDLKMVEMLVAHKACISSRNNTGKNSIEIAEANGHLEIATYLKEQLELQEGCN